MSRKIATLWDNKSSDDRNNEHSHMEGQSFYAGGSEHSGQQILGPSRDAPEATGRLVESLFNHARQSANLVNDQSSSTSSVGSTTLPIIFWRNGFTVGEEGELRQYESPSNRQFLESLKRGETPPELASRVRGGMIDVKLENKAQQDHKPERKFKAFSGEGHRLGAPTPETSDSTQSSTK